jgi:hypothetical protein
MIEKVILQLEEDDYKNLLQELDKTGGEKFIRLLEFLRNNPEGGKDDVIKNELSLKDSAYYTLKSRLFDKIQQYLFIKTRDNSANLIVNISSIAQLTYNTPRETAICLLEYLEDQLKTMDMPNELVTVYNALKKHHHNNEKFFHYQQLYNKNVAYALAIDKAEELLLTFNKILADYNCSGNKEQEKLLKLYIKEIENVNKLYESNRLTLLRNIMYAQYAVFIDPLNQIPDKDITVEQVFKQSDEIMESGPDDRQYKYYSLFFNYLKFEYYRKLKLYKNCDKYVNTILEHVNTFSHLSKTLFVSRFLLSILETTIANDSVLDIPKMEQLIEAFEKNNNSVSEQIYSAIAAAAFKTHKENYSLAEQHLNNLLNNVSFKNYLLAETEVKLLLSYILLLQKKYDLAEVNIRSINRKISSADFTDNFPNAIAFSKFLKTSMSSISKKQEKLKRQLDEFKMFNNNYTPVLKYLMISDNHIKQLL